MSIRKFAIARSFEKKREGSAVQGHIGALTIEGSISDVTCNGSAVPAQSVDAWLYYGMQLFLDSYASATSLTDAQERFNAKVQKFMDGELNARGEGVDSFQKVARQVVYAYLKLKKPEAHKEIKDMDSPKEKGARLDDIYGKNEAVFKPMVEKEIAARAEAAAKAKELADSIEIEI
jgi:hypothetical protein